MPKSRGRTRYINIYEAKTALSRLVDRAAGGEEIVIARAGRPIAKLVAYQPPRPARKIGLYDGQIQIAPDFDQTPPELIRLFEEGER